MGKQLLPHGNTASNEYIEYVGHRAFLKSCILAIQFRCFSTNFRKQVIHHLFSLLAITAAKQIQMIQNVIEII
jgi:hypothetical protein